VRPIDFIDLPAGRETRRENVDRRGVRLHSGDHHVYGAPQHAPLLDVDIPI
jgi:precorrin-4 methylase